MRVVVKEYANDVPQHLDADTITIDPENIVVKVGVPNTTVEIIPVVLEANVGELNVKVNQGTQGPQGPPGEGGITETYSVTNISSWYHHHDFSYYPDVRLVAEGVLAAVGAEYPDESTVYIEFPQPFTGLIILS